MGGPETAGPCPCRVMLQYVMYSLALRPASIAPRPSQRCRNPVRNFVCFCVLYTSILTPTLQYTVHFGKARRARGCALLQLYDSTPSEKNC